MRPPPEVVATEVDAAMQQVGSSSISPKVVRRRLTDRDKSLTYEDATAAMHAAIESGLVILTDSFDLTTTRPGDVRGTDHTKETGDE